MFKLQPLFCNNCGFLYRGIPTNRAFSFCSKGCLEELQLKYACYILGKDYVPKVAGADPAVPTENEILPVDRKS